MRFVLPILSLAVLLAAVPASATKTSPHPQADTYFQLRDHGQVLASFSMDEIQARPQSFAGKLLEVRGIISATAGSDAHTTLLISAVEGGQAVAVVLPPDKKLADWAFLDVGTTVRVLAKVVTEAGSNSGALELVSAVKEKEAELADLTRAAEAAAKQREAEKKRAAALKKKVQPKMASRGVTASTYRKTTAHTSTSDYVTAYAEAVRYFNRRLAVSEARKIAACILQYSTRHNLDPRLVMAVIAVESRFNQNAVSPVGAMGLGQLMPGTASDLGVGNAFDLHQNLEGSTRLLSRHLQNMASNGEVSPSAIKLALACYNAGAGAVKKYKGIPPYRETQNYVRIITRLYFQMLTEPEKAYWAQKGWKPA